MNKQPLRTIKITELECFRCGHRWFPKPDPTTGQVILPLKCANFRYCARYDWNIETVRSYNKKVR